MKKILLSIMAMVAVFVANAAVVTNPDLNYFSEDFSNGIPEGWTQYGAGKTAVKDAQAYFPVGGDPYQPLKFSDGTVYAMSNSWTQEGGVVDEWLVTPAIEVPVDAAMLVYTVMAYGATTDSNYALYISTTGNKREDFTEAPIYDAKLKGNAQGNPTQRTNRQTLEGYAGQTIYIAFVNASNDAFMLGFTDIKLCQYDIAVTNQTPSFTMEPGETKLDLTVQIRTPFACSGYTAKLTTNTGIEDEDVVEKNLKSSYSSTRPTFDPISVSKVGEAVSYTVTITPNAEGAIPTTVKGTYALADTYPGVCVMEEATGENCAYCTRGIAALDYYSATYGDQFIGIAVHCGGYSTGVMEFASYDPLLNEGITGFPAAVFNRAEVTDPATESVVKRLINKETPAKVEIGQLVYNPEESQKITINYQTTLGYSATDPNIGVAAVVIADGLTGTDTQRWRQLNAYSGTSKASIVSMYGEAWWPYFQWICESPSTITDIEFNHVACGIYDDYYGETGALKGTYNMGQPKTSTLTFDMPIQKKPNGPGVQDVTKTSVAVLLLDLNSGEIIGADKIHYEEYSKVNSLGEVAAASYKAFQEGDNLKVVAEEGTNVTIASVDGKLLGSYVMSSETMTLNGDVFDGVLVVRMNKGNNTNIAKVIWK